MQEETKVLLEKNTQLCRNNVKAKNKSINQIETQPNNNKHLLIKK